MHIIVLATLLSAVPVHLGSAHQTGALTLFTIVLFVLHGLRAPRAAAAGLGAARRVGKSMSAAHA